MKRYIQLYFVKLTSSITKPHKTRGLWWFWWPNASQMTSGGSF